MTGTEVLRNDHNHIKRFEEIISKCYKDLYLGKQIPLTDLDKISNIISEFLDSIHYSREENSYFPCVASYDVLKKEIRELVIEHEFSRRIAIKISTNLQQWKDGEDRREPVARFLRTYSIYLRDHLTKEEDFFKKAEETVLSREEEMEMFTQFQSVIAVTTKIEKIIEEIDFLQNQNWFKST